MDMVRLGASLGYLAATGVWLILMGVAGGLRCDDGCSGPPYRGWEDIIHAWQYGVLAPLALPGATLALLAVILALGDSGSAGRRWLSTSAYSSGTWAS